jgi:fructose-1,6-bisphosphatase/inositol monophosphatase family enzyme
MNIDLDQLARIMKEVADEEIVPRFRRLSGSDVSLKRGVEVVTVADVEAEKVLSRRLPDLLPGSRVIGEESVSASPSLLAGFRADDPVWIVDPVDGTRCFASGDDRFAVMVALCVARKPVAAGIWSPIRKTGFFGSRDGGLLVHGETIPPVVEHSGVCAYDVKQLAEPRRDEVVAGLLPFGGRRHVNSSHEYIEILSGRCDGFVATHLTPWDVAPGAFLIRQAGGYATMVPSGSDWDVSHARGILVLGREGEFRDRVAALVTQDDHAGVGTALAWAEVA